MRIFNELWAQNSMFYLNHEVLELNDYGGHKILKMYQEKLWICVVGSAKNYLDANILNSRNTLKHISFSFVKNQVHQKSRIYIHFTIFFMILQEQLRSYFEANSINFKLETSLHHFVVRRTRHVYDAHKFGYLYCLYLFYPGRLKEYPNFGETCEVRKTDRKIHPSENKVQKMSNFRMSSWKLSLERVMKLCSS